MKLHGMNLVGNDRRGAGTHTFRAAAPGTGELLETDFHEAGKEEIDTAVEKAVAAFAEYSQKTNKEKAAFLRLIGEHLRKVQDDITERCMPETALPQGRLKNEMNRTVGQLNLFADLVEEGSWVDARIDKVEGKPDIRQMQVPLGPVGVFGSSNFPLAFSVAGGDTVSALAAGCPVVFKAHPLHPGTSEMAGEAILRAAEESQMPDGVFSLLHSSSHLVGMQIVNHPKIKAVGFTGSFNGGKAIYDEAQKRDEPIPVFAEMGSTNPVFILPGALKDKSLPEGLAGSINLGVGQFCTNPGLLILEESEDSGIFLREFGDLIGNTGSGVMLSEGIKTNYERAQDKYSGKAEVVNLYSSGGEETGNRVRSIIYKTSAEYFLKNPIMEEEVFGPSSLLVSARSGNEMLRVAENLKGHLTATIIGDEEELRSNTELIRILQKKVGRLIFNGFPTGVEVCHAMVHGGPFPATTAVQSTSVGTAAIRRFSRPLCYQDFPEQVLPGELIDSNPLGILRLMNGEYAR